MRKLKNIKKDRDEAEARLAEIKKLEELAKKEELEKIESLKEKIDSLCSTGDVFCGIILTKEDVLAIVQLAVESKDNIKIPYALYFND